MPYPYETLELPESVSQAEIRKRYLEKIQVYGPEHHPEQFQEIVTAYEHLKSEEKRTRLKCFGMSGSSAGLKIADLLPLPRNRRQRIGADQWLQAIRETITEPEKP